ncbi:cytochrome c biogenesis CcdA family protein [Agromyces sp. Leaf222]|uniref:cytochrome c biogenesis CcdA family protein n=1 Tax=Agromyces sp. Leaf222 TaxID=1735688 RepID=UPI0006F735B9|nr:cytochrome c biogenesis protein CcdA [Agromyces sp. Leaf222]KQM83628.1 cytochrome C biogenesis protein [Agromyces sp. Leaf222]
MIPDSVFTVVLTGELILAIPIALAAGLISFASPCVLPLVPGYLGFIGGIAHPAQSSKRLVAGTVLFIAGFGMVFVAYGAIFGVLGSVLIAWQDLITRALGIIIILMGLVFTGRIRFFQRIIKPQQAQSRGILGAPILGVVFGLGWTPCMGPTLTAIAALSLDGGSALRGALLGLVYCLGLGLPFLFLALGFSWASTAVMVIRAHLRSVNLAGGLLLILIGVLMLTGVWSTWLYQLQAVIGGVVLPI